MLECVLIMSKDKMFKYELISFSPLPFYLPRPTGRGVVVKMTEEEAYNVNQSLILNGMSKRYVRIDDDK